jgi:hypothetical protein
MRELLVLKISIQSFVYLSCYYSRNLRVGCWELYSEVTVEFMRGFREVWRSFPSVAWWCDVHVREDDLREEKIPG